MLTDLEHRDRDCIIFGQRSVCSQPILCKVEFPGFVAPSYDANHLLVQLYGAPSGFFLHSPLGKQEKPAPSLRFIIPTWDEKEYVLFWPMNPLGFFGDVTKLAD